MTLIHLQAAACARPTRATLGAQVDHLRREVELGGYVAETAVTAALDRARTALGDLLGVPGPGVLLTDSATSGLALLLATWPLPAVPVVGVAPSEWGPNLDRFARRGAQLVRLEVDAGGRLDLDALAGLLASGSLDLVHVVHAASHRGLVQPVADVVALGRAHGTPVWVDAAQALGQHDTAYAADAAYAPGRKWLRGPRGTGVLALHPDRSAIRAAVALAEPGDVSVAAQVGLARAVDELVATDPARVRGTLAQRGDRLRAALSEVAGWAVVDDPRAGGAIVGLAPLADHDVERVQQRLLSEHQVLTTASLPWRAPGDMAGPLLRMAPHVDVTDEELDRAALALASMP